MQCPSWAIIARALNGVSPPWQCTAPLHAMSVTSHKEAPAFTHIPFRDMRVRFLSCCNLGGDVASDAGLTEFFISIKVLAPAPASCGLFIPLSDWEEDAEPSSSLPRPPCTLPWGQPPQDGPCPCQSAPTHVFLSYGEACPSLEANSASGPMGTACQAPLQLSQSDRKDTGAPRLSHNYLALQSQQRPSRASSSLLPSSANTDPPNGHSQKPERPL